MAYRIDFVGLVNFFDQGRDGKLLLLPDGNRPELNIPPHRANIVVLGEQVEDELTSWPPENDEELEALGLLRFHIGEPATIAISGLLPGGADGPLDTREWDGLVPLLRKIDPDLEIAPSHAATIAQIPVAHGRLEAFKYGKDSTVGQLTVRHEGLVEITATPRNGGEAKTLTLTNGSEIVISNLSSIKEALPQPNAEPESHFKLYGQLDKERRSDNLDPKKDPTRASLGQIPSGHPYLAFLLLTEENFPAPDCPVTGCCPG